MLLILLACAKSPAPTAAPEAAPTEALAPRLFDADGLRDGFVLGTRLVLRIEAAGAPTIVEEWTVTGHTPEGCTIHSVTRDEAGTVLKEEDGTSTWTELEGHASFPADATVMLDTTTETPMGTLDVRRYTVREDDGSVKVLHFAKSYAGPPVRMEVTKDGALVLAMTMIERTAP